MNVIILRKLSDYGTLTREDIMQAHLILCGSCGVFKIMKDRMENRYDETMSSEYLSKYLEKYS